MIKYIGSKRVVIPNIVRIVRSLPSVSRVVDLFAGTTRVGRGLKAHGCFVISNDLATYSEVFARTYVQADRDKVDLPRINRLLAYLRALPGKPGYFTRVFCEEARYFQPHNGARIDAIREAIDELSSTEEDRSILLTALLLAADRVDSTTGLQMAYLKEWASRSYQDLDLRLPELLSGPGLALRQDANELARQVVDVDLAYVDPPYNQHSFFSNYHVWETLVRNDQPETYGIARKRIDCKTNKSLYNSKREIEATFANLISSLQTRYMLVSFNNEGYLDRDFILRVLRDKGYVDWVSIDFKRYVGAQIGIFNPSGEKVGAISHLRNREYLFLVGPTRGVVEDAVANVRTHQKVDQPTLFPSTEAAGG